MNKEDVLHEYDYDGTLGVNTEEIYKAMDQYAKQQCIELLNWMFAGAAETIPYPGPNMWLRDLANEYKDSEAFYNAFLTEQSKEQ